MLLVSKWNINYRTTFTSLVSFSFLHTTQ